MMKTQFHSTLTLRKADRDLAVGTSQIDGVFSGVAQDTKLDDNDNIVAGRQVGGTWNELKQNMQLYIKQSCL